MTRKKTTMYIEENLLRSAKVLAARRGKKEYEVFEEALKNYFGLDVVEKVWARSDLSEAQALDLAYRELHAMRKAKR